MTHDFQDDIDAVQGIDAVRTILDVVCRSTGMGFAAVARVTEDRWIACQVLDNIAFGLPAGGEIPVETTLCHEVRQLREVIVIDNVAEHPVYCSHHTPRLYGLQTYISMPIVLPDGRYFGTLCAIDPKPAKLDNPQTLGMFKLFAELIAHHLDSQARLRVTQERLLHAQANLIDANTASQLREQFIAVLGHDLRNPLASMSGGINMLLREPQSERSTKIINLMRGSVLRMSGLIDNVMDFARGRLGGGLGLEKEATRPVGPTLMQVISEIQTAHPERSIEVEIDLAENYEIDHDRLSQMFSNLLGNAITHGATDHPIRINGVLEDGHLTLAIANKGSPIPPKILANLFQPFSRNAAGTQAEGLGLGLYIASEIAAAHGGRIDVSSDDTETVFTFRMPTGVSAT